MFPLHDVAADSFGPDAKLLDGGSSECIASAEEDTVSFSGEAVGEFRDGSRFAGAVDADDQDDRRAGGGVSEGRLFASESISQFIANDLEGLFHIDPAAAELRVDRIPDFRGHPIPHIGFHQDGEEFF